MNILIVIPTYNEALNVEKLVNEIKNNLQDERFSILFVDDNSNDGTIDLINKLKQENSNIHLLQRPSKMGLASAYIDGFQYGIENGYEYFIQMDADFSHNPVYLPKFFDAFKSNDLIIASRNIKGGAVKNWGILRNLISKGGSLYSKIILNVPYCDLTGGFNGWSKEILQKIDLNKVISKGFSFQIEMKYRAYKNKANALEFPIIFEDRKFGQSKMNKSIFLEALLNVLKIRFMV